MKRSWGLLPKILRKEKTIESRWYKNRYSPWGKIKKEDTVYFKDSGKPVTARAKVSDVFQYSDLTPTKVKEILLKYGSKDGLGLDEIDKYYKMFKNKNYCLLIFLKDPRRVEPFEVNKDGFGAMSSWIVIDNIDKLKKPWL